MKTKVDPSHISNPVLVYNHNTPVAYVSFEDIPKVILEATPSDRLTIVDILDRFICDTLGNLLFNMEQTSENFQWRDRLISMEEAQEDGLLPAHALDYEYAPY